MDDLKSYIQANKDRFVEELFSLIRIPSISSEESHKPDMIRCAERWKELILAAGADKCEVMPTKGNPVVYGERIVSKDAPTVLVYGHYDVMPVDPLELWKTDPFNPVIKDGKIYARGADDDKGQSFMHAKAFEYLVQTRQLNCNVKFMIEGEEEIGSGNLYEFCKANKEMLQSDVILVSDTSMIASDVPSITVGLRGLTYLEVEVTGPNKDLHSGLFGGAVANPINELCKMIASLTDENNRITIPCFYDDVREVSEHERKLMAEAPFNLAAYKKALEIEEVQGEKGFSTIERTGIRPTFDVCGIWGGYTGEGAKTVLPAKAHAKLSMRLVPDQDSHQISKLFEKHFESIAPKSVKVKVHPGHGGEAYVSPIDHPGYKAAEKAYKAVYAKNPIPTRSGGSIPVIAGFDRILGTKSILMGFGLEEDAIHSPNESYKIDHFLKGIETIAHFYPSFEQEMKAERKNR
ncbi:MAG: dipeptidase [Dysgonamonadaceae bacterium]|jgi:acetylornithine deacetylase/succinyl-diaminopimelate desuccinylase-like protein|nr:dipeptidase [Dysgonamonadaceae bacterium]